MTPSDCDHPPVSTDVAIADGAFRDFKRSLFDNAVSDSTGVYEAWWEANSKFPEAPLSQRLQLAERAVRELLAARLVHLYRGTREEPEREQIAPDESDEVLNAWETWAIPEGPKVFMGADEPSDSATWQSIHDSL